MRAKEEERKERKRAEEEEASRETFKLKRFRDVKSRVRSSAASSDTAEDGGRRERREFLRRGAGTSASAARRSSAAASRRAAEAAAAEEEERSAARRRARAKKKPAVPRRDERPTLAPREDKDFIRRNAKSARRAPVRKEEGKRSAEHERGTVPEYLLRRKEELVAEAEAARAVAEDDTPEGMVLLSEEERLQTLADLEASEWLCAVCACLPSPLRLLDVPSPLCCCCAAAAAVACLPPLMRPPRHTGKREVDEALRKFPIAYDTPKLVRRKEELESRLLELEATIEVFSRDKVYVMDD
eukprot:PLAT4602.2.p1 GENE.PLAT4602.2~~PLAT4602.2.p1  ORF type:complete len:351 (+),score=133.05 PLAT4602.2:157-1053(+)